MEELNDELALIEKLLAFLERRRSRLLHELAGHSDDEVIERSYDAVPSTTPWD